MVPRVIAHFVPVSGDRYRAIAISLRPVSGNKKRTVHVRAFQSSDQILKAFRIRAGVECERDLGFSTRPALDFIAEVWSCLKGFFSPRLLGGVA